jgi:hypothetical protein
MVGGLLRVVGFSFFLLAALVVPVYTSCVLRVPYAF